MKSTIFGLFALCAFMTASTSTAADRYAVDSNHTFPSYEVKHFGWSLQRGRFEKVTGTIMLDRAAKTGSLDIQIDVASVSTGVAKLDEHLRHEDFFHAAKFPQITFKSKSMRFNGDSPVSVDGSLTMRGVTRPLTLAINSFHCAPNPYAKKEVCGADAEAMIKRSDFGISYGLPNVADDVKLLINVEAIKE